LASPSWLARRRTVIVLLTLLSVTLLTLDLRGNAVIDAARGAAIDVFAPVRGAGTSVIRPVQNAWHGVTDYSNMKKQNDALRDQVALQEGASIAAEAQVREYQELLATNKLPTVANIPTVLAQVVSRPASNFESTIEINQGSRVGIRVGMPVVTPAGLVGRITRVTEIRSVVRLITDPELNVAVKIVGPPGPVPSVLPPPSSTSTPTAPATTPPTATTAPPPAGAATTTRGTTVPPPPSLPPAPSTLPPSTLPGAPTTATTGTSIPVDQMQVRELGIGHGQGSGKDLTVDFVDSETQLQVGDPVVTSGVDQSLSPADIPVGRVSSVKRLSGSFQLDVKVKPSVDLENLTFVKVLLYVPQL
jgi:rod shape-determining protein MreC